MHLVLFPLSVRFDDTRRSPTRVVFKPEHGPSNTTTKRENWISDSPCPFVGHPSPLKASLNPRLYLQVLIVQGRRSQHEVVPAVVHRLRASDARVRRRGGRVLQQDAVRKQTTPRERTRALAPHGWTQLSSLA